MNNFSRNTKIIVIALIAAIIALGVFMWSHRAPVPVAATAPVVRFLPGDGKLKTEVGALSPANDAIASKGSRGVLVFGPYVAMAPGSYSVSWLGSAQASSAPRLEVTSMKTGLIASAAPQLAATADRHALHTMVFTLTQAVSDVEFRVLVEPGDALTINEVDLSTLSGTAGAK